MAAQQLDEAIRRGEFDNLPGAGKPLKTRVDHAPGMDSYDYHLNKVLINADYTPDWIAAQRTIRGMKQRFRDQLETVLAPQLAALSAKTDDWTCLRVEPDLEARARERILAINREIERWVQTQPYP
ncbi:uncharacterized protein MONBRDRAFT_29262 [Monosiga brevicollis MX1]|uniref:DnaJ homologue subfamily C member 28 conserved domain-containing protein n=1 Tax=Monosiga brevicollis TaxID=81824 RepID=A9VAK9_MONBE|nr:uncharacterized protein MONBRDRAFT_29262 [Monosiga brevicollis MX1]EDQ85340.1 predicted protein [Monosiga brevicollis MX1]|eukprot:XP_001749751.1 hypothetical protein [Monosiga brevicollis MX1]